MSAIATLPPPQVIPPQALDVFRLAQEVRNAAKAYKSSTMRLAYYGWRLRYQLADDWSPLGVASEDDFRESLGISQSTYYRSLRIGQVLHNLKLEDLEQISVSNAELLLQVPPELFQDFDWVKEAKTLSPHDLAQKIVQRNRQHGSDREPMTYWRVKVPFTAKKFLEETVEKFRLENGLASAGEAVELLIADVHDRPNVMLAVKRANDYIDWAMWRFRRKRESTEVQWLYRASRLLYKAYWAVRMDYPGDVHAENKKAVYPAKDEQDGQDFTQWRREMFEQPGGESRKTSTDHVTVAPPEWYLRPINVPETDESDGDDDSFEDAG